MRYTFTATGIPKVVVLRGTAAPKIDSGFAKYSVIDRPKKTGSVQYEGLDPIRMSLPVLFDGWIQRTPVEDDIQNMIRMQREVTGSNQDSQPPDVRVNQGTAGGIPIKDTIWKIESIDWGDVQIWDFQTRGVLVRFRQDAVIHMLERVDSDTLGVGANLSGISRVTDPPKGSHNSHLVVAGETLPQIAIKEYKGNRSAWKAIAKANGIRDPRSIKDWVGKTLRLP